MTKLLGTLVSLELTSPDVEGSVQFYEHKFGMRAVERTDNKVYLRCWGDYFRYSIVITRGTSPALVNMTWRAESDAALDELAQRVEASGVVGEWHDGAQGHGRTYSFVGRTVIE
jgi:catechol 2,3-dioxygenase